MNLIRDAWAAYVSEANIIFYCSVRSKNFLTKPNYKCSLASLIRVISVGWILCDLLASELSSFSCSRMGMELHANELQPFWQTALNSLALVLSSGSNVTWRKKPPFKLSIATLFDV